MRCPFPLPILPKFRDFSIRDLVECQKILPNKLEAESGVFADILPADGGAASGLLERMKEGGATASGLLKEGGAGLERMFSRGMKWLDEG